MAIEYIPINSGTGPRIAVDQVGSNAYQVVKIVQATDGSAGSLENIFSVTNTGTAVVNVATITTVLAVPVVTVTASANPLIVSTVSTVLAMPVLSAANVTIASIATGTVTVKAVTTGTVNVVNVLSASGVTVASIATGTVNVVSMPVLSATNVTIASVTTGTISVVNVLSASGVTVANVATITTLLGTIAVSGGGGGVQYSIGDTSMAATGTGSLILGMQSGATTSRALALTTSGGIQGMQIIATVSTLLGTVAVSGGGGGVQYPVSDTSMGATGTGTLILGMQSGATTARGLAVTTTGAAHVAVQGVVSASGVTIASIATGTVNVVSMPVLSATNVTIASVATGTVNVVSMPVLSATNVTIASVATGTVSVVSMPVLSATNVTIASIATGTVTVKAITTGTVNVVNVISATGVLLAATTANVGAFVCTAHASRWDAYAVNTTSGSTVILKTSGAHTLYVTDLMVSVDTPMTVTIYSSVSTAKMVAYLATKGGFTMSLTTPMALNSAQSLRFAGGASGSCAAFAAGFTVT